MGIRKGEVWRWWCGSISSASPTTLRSPDRQVAHQLDSQNQGGVVVARNVSGHERRKAQGRLPGRRWKVVEQRRERGLSARRPSRRHRRRRCRRDEAFRRLVPFAAPVPERAIDCRDFGRQYGRVAGALAPVEILPQPR